MLALEPSRIKEAAVGLQQANMTRGRVFDASGVSLKEGLESRVDRRLIRNKESTATGEVKMAFARGQSPSLPRGAEIAELLVRPCTSESSEGEAGPTAFVLDLSKVT